MGLYIKNMEMPKEGSWTTVRVYPDGTCAVPNWQGDCTLIKGTKAVYVPPHGRLIDADELMHEFEKAQQTMAQHGREYSCSFMSSGQEISTEWYCVEDMLENAPTILPAEEGER